MDIITVQYESKKQPGTFGGREYTYIADREYEAGDVVTAPTRYGVSLALVTAIGIDENTIPEYLREVLLHITGPVVPLKTAALEDQRNDL